MRKVLLSAAVVGLASAALASAATPVQAAPETYWQRCTDINNPGKGTGRLCIDINGYVNGGATIGVGYWKTGGPDERVDVGYFDGTQHWQGRVIYVEAGGSTGTFTWGVNPLRSKCYNPQLRSGNTQVTGDPLCV